MLGYSTDSEIDACRVTGHGRLRRWRRGMGWTPEQLPPRVAEDDAGEAWVTRWRLATCAFAPHENGAAGSGQEIDLTTGTMHAWSSGSEIDACLGQRRRRDRRMLGGGLSAPGPPGGELVLPAGEPPLRTRFADPDLEQERGKLAGGVRGGEVFLRSPSTHVHGSDPSYRRNRRRSAEERPTPPPSRPSARFGSGCGAAPNQSLACLGIRLRDRRMPGSSDSEIDACLDQPTDPEIDACLGQPTPR